MLTELFKEIERFQQLKEITGCTKSSSYGVSLYFDPHEDHIIIELGGYDIGSWNRHTYLETNKENLIFDLHQKVEEAIRIVNEEREEYND